MSFSRNTLNSLISSGSVERTYLGYLQPPVNSCECHKFSRSYLGDDAEQIVVPVGIHQIALARPYAMGRVRIVLEVDERDLVPRVLGQL